MPNQNDIAALYTSSPALLSTALVILVVIALILISWGACLYGTIASCAARRRQRYDEEEVDRRRKRADAFVLGVVNGGRVVDLEMGSVRSGNLRRQSSRSSERTLVPAGSVVTDLGTVSEEGKGEEGEEGIGRRKTGLYDSMV